MTIEIQLPRVERAGGWSWARETATLLAKTRSDGAELLAAVDYFERRLGHDWPGWEQGRPLASAFFTGVNGDTVSGIELFRLLSLVEGRLDLGELLGQLQSSAWEQFVAAGMVLEISSRAVAANVAVELLRAQGKPVADLRLKVDSRWITVECVALHESALMRDAEAVHDEFQRWLFEQGLDRLGRTEVAFIGEPSPTAVRRRLGELKAAVREAAHADVGNVDVPDFATIRFQRGLSPLPFSIGRMGGEPIDTDVRRLRLRLREKHVQLAGQGASLLIARTRFLFTFEVAREPMLASVLSMLSEELARFTEVGGVLVYETWLGSPPAPRLRRARGCAIEEGIDRRGRSRVAALLAGRAAEHPLSDAEISAFFGVGSFW